MNKSAFLKLIKQVSNISEQQQAELEQVAATFPYCQTAHLLLAKSAYDKGSMLSTQRLRKASAYATDRQLLKRIIYTSAVPIPEPVAVTEPVRISEEEEVQDTPEVHTLPDPEDVIEPASPAEEEQNPSNEAETLEDVYSPTQHTEPESHNEYTNEPEELESQDGELNSELALLFTFNSISSSSTDLLGSRELNSNPEDDEAIPALPEANHLEEAEELLEEIEQQSPSEDEISSALETELPQQTDELAAPTFSDSQENESSSLAEFEDEALEAQEPIASLSPADAEINYSTDEIDRLFAEDAIGYWMGSSRMGEVLQLKDDYTRPRPQSFHPELILEYSKTHELEKAIQPAENALSDQVGIIDQFLKLNPRLKTMANLKFKPEPQEDLSLKSSKIKKGMASESLAAIFLKQGKTKKAVKIYEQLILKYPEKKSYFAEQIEKLQNIT